MCIFYLLSFIINFALFFGHALFFGSIRACDLYYEVWQRFDPNRTKYIKYCQLSDYVDSLYEKAAINACNSTEENDILYESPLRIPNQEKLISMNM